MMRRGGRWERGVKKDIKADLCCRFNVRVTELSMALTIIYTMSILMSPLCSAHMHFDYSCWYGNTWTRATFSGYVKVT